MRKVLFFIVVLAAVAVPVAVANNGATTTHFTVAYQNIAPDGTDYGFFTCSGERIVKTGPSAFVKDSETCATTGGIFVPNGTYPTSEGWVSDFDPLINPGCVNPSIAGTITVRNHGDGSTWTLDAYYDPAFICP